MTNPYAPLEPEVPRDYLPPMSAYGPEIEQFTLENDPLVNDTTIYGLGGWFTKTFAVVKRSWKPLLGIFALTSFLPNLILGLLGAGAGYAILADPATSQDVGGAALLLAVILTPLVIVGLLLGYGAATYAATRQAAGLTVGIGEALRYGLRRCLGLTGWFILVGLMAGAAFMIVGLCTMSIHPVLGIVILLPFAVYAFLAMTMVGPVYLFERRAPIGRSFALLHGAFGKVFGRLFLVGLAYAVGLGVEQAVTLSTNVVVMERPAMIIAAAVGACLVALIELPLTILQFSGVLVTYAERRGDEGATTTELVNSL